MNITFGLTVFKWRISTFDVHIEIDQNAGETVAPVIKGVVKGFSRGWFKRMVS